MSASSTTAVKNLVTPTPNPFDEARARLIERLALLVTPKPIRIFPAPSDFQAVRDLLRETAEVFDDFVAAIGGEIEANSPYNVDARSFDAVASCAIADASFECERIAERLSEDREAA